MAVVVDAVILAGGEGRRLGGVDKGWVMLAGKPLVQWARDAVFRQTVPARQLWVSANRNQDRYAMLGAVVGDRSPGFAGPLAGIDAAFAASDADWLWIVPCDTPLLPDDTLSRLLTGIGNADAAVAVTEAGWQPTVCLAHRRTWPALQARLAAGQGSVRHWLTACGAAEVYFDEAAAFTNTNDADALARLAAELSHGAPTHVEKQGREGQE